MDSEARQMHRRAVTVAIAATVVALLGQHAASRTSKESLSGVRHRLGDAWLVSQTPRAVWGTAPDVREFGRPPAVWTKPGGECPSGKNSPPPQLALRDERS